MDRFTASVVVLGVALVAVGGGRDDPGDETTPRGVVVLYLRSLREGNQDRAYDLLADEVRARVSRAEFIRLAAFLQNDRQRYRVGEATIEGSNARVPVVYFSGGGLFRFGRGATTQTTALVQEGGRWRISAPTEPYLPERPVR
jgi:hypothetical protein